MILYCDPLATSCKPVLDLIRELHLEVAIHKISLQQGEHRSPGFLQVNPSGQLPVLVDGDFTLIESTAILRYLAADSRFDLQDRRAAARVNEAIDWFKTGFAVDFCLGYAYPQFVASLRHPNPQVQAELTARALQRSIERFDVLDRRWLGDGRAFLCGDELSLADLAAAPMVELADVVGFDLKPHPNVRTWLDRVVGRRPPAGA